jgi:DNA-binding NarL/FixJ family response regulator
MDHGTISDAARREAIIRVLVVDDHDLFRTGMASLLGSEPDIEVVGQASGARAGIRLADELRPDVVLMDLQMPDLDGTEAIREIVDLQPSVRVIALTVLSGDQDVENAVQAGAVGFLAKETPVDEVAAAVVLGRIRNAAPEPTTGGPALEQLSPRELDVLRLIARGMENSEIAAELEISPRTVKNHVSSVLAKLGLPSRIQAAIYAVRSGLE